MKNPSIAVTDYQLKMMKGGGQKVVQALVNNLEKSYPVFHVGYPGEVKCKRDISPYVEMPKAAETKVEALKSNKLLNLNPIKKLIRYAFHRFRFVSNRTLKKAEVPCDIIISNSNYDDIIMLNDSRFHLNYKAAIFIKHNPYYDFNWFYPDRLIKDKVFRIIALNSVDYKLLSIKYSKKNVRLIYPVIELKKARPEPGYIEKLGITDKHRVIVSIGRFDETQKKLSVAITAIALASKLDDNLRYFIAGSGQDQALYEKLIVKYGLENKVKILGFISDSQKYSLMQRGDIVLQPSVRENFSSVTLEAMTYGSIILTSRNSGSVDIVNDGKNGFFLEMNAEDIASKILKILSLDKVKTRKIKNNAIKTASRFSSKEMINQYKAVIDEIAGEI